MQIVDHGVHTPFGIQAAGLNLLNGVMDFASRDTGTLGQFTHFIGHHRKAAPLFTGARRLDGRIQRQQVRLLGHIADHRHNRRDVVDLIGQLINPLLRLAHIAFNIGQATDCCEDGLVAIVRLQTGLLTLLPRLLGLLGGIAGLLAKLMRSGGNTVGGIALLLNQLGAVLGITHNRAAVLMQVRDTLLQLLHHIMQRLAHAQHRGVNTDIITIWLGMVLAQIAIGDRLHQLFHIGRLTA